MHVNAPDAKNPDAQVGVQVKPLTVPLHPMVVPYAITGGDDMHWMELVISARTYVSNTDRFFVFTNTEPCSCVCEAIVIASDAFSAISEFGSKHAQPGADVSLVPNCHDRLLLVGFPVAMRDTTVATSLSMTDIERESTK